MTTRKDGDKNQIITNYNGFSKTINNQIKMASDKTYTKKTNIYFIRKNMGFFLNATW